MLDDNLDAKLRELLEQWNIAEGRIKQAENARAQEIVSSAIYELRYAGRKVIDAIELVLNSNWTTDRVAYNQIHEFIDDAIEDCVKAKHDAIDAVMSFVVRWFSDQERIIGLDNIQRFYPNYLAATAKITDMQDKIEESRKDRTKLRTAIYNEIEKGGYDEVLTLYKQMRDSKHRVDAAVKRRSRKDRWLLYLAIAGAVGVAISVVHFAVYYYRG
jgi:hypothetical protein